MHVPGVLPITVVRGDRFELPLTLKENRAPEGEEPDLHAVDLTDVTLRAQVRSKQKVDAPLLAEFAAEATEEPGQLVLSLSPAQTIELRKSAFWGFQTSQGDPLRTRTWVIGPLTLRDVPVGPVQVEAEPDA
jgi:hypothetical protein